MEVFRVIEIRFRFRLAKIDHMVNRLASYPLEGSRKGVVIRVLFFTYTRNTFPKNTTNNAR